MDPIEIERRKPVWSAISEFYLDTELDLKDISRIKEVFKNSGYSLDELKNIDFYEVRPIVGSNLWSTAGEWAGFDKNWLWNEIQTITLSRERKTNFFEKWKRERFESSPLSNWNKFHSNFQDLVDDQPLIKIQTAGKLYNCVLKSNTEWEIFYEYSAKIRARLNIDYHDKIDDIDSKYWDFQYCKKTFTLHYHSMVKDVEIHTEPSNGTDEFQKLLRQLED